MIRHRSCFMGQARFRELESLLPEPAPVFGIDEHAACILDLESDAAWAEQGSVDAVVQARDTLREWIVLLGNELDASPGREVECLTPLVEALLELRATFRSRRQWAAADAIRDVLGTVRITVEDTANGVRWRREP